MTYVRLFISLMGQALGEQPFKTYALGDAVLLH